MQREATKQRQEKLFAGYGHWRKRFVWGKAPRFDQFASNAHKLEPFIVSLNLSGLCTSRARRPLLTQDRPADRFILMIDDLAVAHAVHVLGVAHWIAGVAAVTTVVLPQAQLLPDANAAIAACQERPGPVPGPSLQG